MHDRRMSKHIGLGPPLGPSSRLCFLTFLFLVWIPLISFQIPLSLQDSIDVLEDSTVSLRDVDVLKVSVGFLGWYSYRLKVSVAVNDNAIDLLTESIDFLRFSMDCVRILVIIWMVPLLL